MSRSFTGREIQSVHHTMYKINIIYYYRGPVLVVTDITLVNISQGINFFLSNFLYRLYSLLTVSVGVPVNGMGHLACFLPLSPSHIFVMIIYFLYISKA